MFIARANFIISSVLPTPVGPGKSSASGRSTSAHAQNVALHAGATVLMACRWPSTSNGGAGQELVHGDLAVAGLLAVGQVEDGRRGRGHVLLGQAAVALHARVLGGAVERVQHQVQVVLVRPARPLHQRRGELENLAVDRLLQPELAPQCRLLDQQPLGAPRRP